MMYATCIYTYGGYTLNLYSTAEVFSLPITEQECTDMDVRLVDGRTVLDGHVEICLIGLWFPVCDTKWDKRDAEVVCWQLGYNRSKFKTFCKIKLINYCSTQPPMLYVNMMANIMQ